MSNVFTVYIVKSFGPDAGYTNLKAFVNEDEAESYANKIRNQIGEDIEDEFVEIEQMDCLSYGTTNRSIDLSFMPASPSYNGSSKIDMSFIPL
jgi:hypothetical protein